MSYFRTLIFMVLANFALLSTVNAQSQETVVTTTQDPIKQEEKVVTTTTTQLPDKTITEVSETTRPMITTPVPTPKEVIATPKGYVYCFTVDSAWFRDTWIPAHRVCQYENTGEGVAWIEGYWACNKSTNTGVCTAWNWRPGRWEKTLTVY